MKRQNKYKVNDFLRYLIGEMTDSERNSFEKVSQRDPFTAEAIEGLETISDLAEKDMKDLQSRLDRRVRRNRKMTIYRIAASIAVLMIISSVFIVVEKNNSIEQESIPEYRSVTMDIAKSEPVYKPEQKDDKAPESVNRKANRIASGQSPAEQPITNVTGDNEAKIQEIEQEKPEDIQTSKKEVMITVRNLPEGDQAIAEGLAETRKAAVAGSRAMTDSAVPAAYKAGDNQPSADYMPPQPLNGIEAFDKYISENLIRPDSATAGQRVVVVTSVKVLSDGTIDSIKIIRSPGKAFSDEAIRLIRSGPSWKPAISQGKAIEDEVRVRIVFP